MKEYIQAGECVKIHGIHGEIKIYSWCDDANFIKKLPRLFFLDMQEKEYKVLTVKTIKNMCVIKLDGINTTQQAHAFVGKIAYFARKDVKLPEGRYFATDIIGFSVKHESTGELYGVITDITNRAGTDIYEIENSDGKAFLFPAVKEFLKNIDIETETVLISPIKGMFDDEE